MKNKRIICTILIVMLIINIVPYEAKAKTKNMYINARSAIAIDSKSQCVLYEKNSDMIVPIASTTKIMTTLVALKYGNLGTKIQISNKAANIHGSQVGYKKGEIITLKELLYGLMLRSGNDAAIAIAEGISGSVEEFCKVMNQYAIEIGALNSHFESPHGLDSQYHYSTAYDLAIITAKAKENEMFNKIVSAKDIEASKYGFTRSYHNINKILYQIPNANGVKTGYTGGAGKCLVTSIQEDKDDIIIVVLNCSTRWNETKKIYKHIKENYEFKKLVSKGESLDSVKFNKKNTVNLISDKDIILPVNKAEDGKINIKVYKPNTLPDKIKKGDYLGRVCIYKDNKLLFSEILKADKTIGDKKYNKIIKLFKRYIKN